MSKGIRALGCEAPLRRCCIGVSAVLWLNLSGCARKPPAAPPPPEVTIAPVQAVLDAQRTQLEAEDRLVRGRGDLARALVEVYRSLAVGGLDDSEAGR